MEHQQPQHHHSGHQHKALIQQLLSCATACESYGASCPDEQDVTRMARRIELDRDCAEICLLGARLLIRDSEFVHDFLVVCEWSAVIVRRSAISPIMNIAKSVHPNAKNARAHQCA